MIDRIMENQYETSQQSQTRLNENNGPNYYMLPINSFEMGLEQT